MASVERDPTR